MSELQEHLLNMSSPEKKRIKMDTGKSAKDDIKNVIIEKRLNFEHQTESDTQKVLQTLRRKNFVTACERVSHNAYFDHQFKLQLVYAPLCVVGECNHADKQQVTPSYAVKSFKIEMNTGMWYEALEVCRMCITRNQYLSADILKDIVEIIMNVHEDVYADYTITDLICKCQLVFALNFSTHPPCQAEDLRKCYKMFLTSPMDLRENTFTNRSSFGSSQGIVKYCMNRLADDINERSKDEPIVNKYENTPEEMKEGVQGLHWQKEKFEIFELLERPERIKRVMAVLESVIELLQFDLAIWQRRHTSKLGKHIMEPKNKPLIAFILWSSNPLSTGAVTNNCIQIMNLFICFIHLQYPEEHIQIMTSWLNTMIQTFYICETNSNRDYPNLGKYCQAFAKKFYEKVKSFAHDSVVRILKRIQPSFMQHLIGIHITKGFLRIKEDNIIRILIDFIKSRQWVKYPESEQSIQLLQNQSIPEDGNNVLQFLTEKCKLEKAVDLTSDNNNNLYPKLQPLEYIIETSDHKLSHVVHVLYITFAAYLDAYSVQQVQDTLDHLNEELAQKSEMEILLPLTSTETEHHYSVSEGFIKKYRSIYQILKELIILWFQMKANNLPEVLKIFENLPILEG